MEGLQSSQLETYVQVKRLSDNFKKSPKDRLTKAYLETRLEMLESYWNKMQSKHDLLVAVSEEEKKILDYFKKNMYDTCLELYLDLKTTIKENINSLNMKCTISSEQMQTNDSVLITQPIAKLSPIQLPQFSGDYKDWVSYHDIFKSLVHDNPTLSNVNKCQYLKASLKGEAENLVKHISVTETNYEIMWDSLQKRYSNRRSIVNAFIGKLLNQKRVTHESSKAIKDLLDITSECLISLKAINIPTDYWDDIVIYIVIQKLDSESHKLFEQRIENIDKLPTWKDLSEFLNFRFRTLEAVKYKDVHSTQSQPRTTTAKSFTTRVSYHTSCLFCNADHRIYSCKQFCDLDVNDRQRYVQKHNLCFNCLRKGHAVKTCNQIACRKCGRKHHTLLHGYSIPASTSTTQQPSELVNIAVLDNTETINRISLKTSTSLSPVILATALIQVQSNSSNCIHTLRALVDQGSQASLITEGACQQLGLRKVPIQGDIVGISSNKSHTKAIVEFELMSRHNPKLKVKVNAYVLRSLSSYIPQQAHSVDWPQLNSLQLADHTFTQPGRIDVLLGADIFADIIQQGLMIYRNENNSLVAQETSLGWLISGSTNRYNNQQRKVVTHHVKIDIDTTLRRFWELEEVPGKKIMTNEELQCEKHYRDTHRRKIDGRYEVQLPFAVNPPDIGESATIALKRLRFVEKQFKRHPDLQNRYNEFMKDCLEQKHMEPIPNSNSRDNNVCYLPHHAVINEQHLTTKLRVVVDASAKTSNSKSLNDNLLIGPSLQADLRDTTLKWRKHSVVLVGDIRQMYRQIEIAEKDRDFLRFFWRFTLDEPIQHFRFTTVTYGTSCAPYLAIKTLKQLAEDEKNNFPKEVIDTILQDFYMDDLLTGSHSIEKTIELQHNIIALLKKGGFLLHKWASNKSEIEALSQTNRKILGIEWNNRSDKFELSFQLNDSDEKPTKRTVLRDIAKLYDPAGWLAPIVIRAKIFLQRLWTEGLDWDDQLSETLATEWSEFRKEICHMPIIQLDRWFGMSDDIVRVEIHGFSDASDVAYSAVVYCRTILPDLIKVTMIEAKTKVAPVKKISTPRLELCGAVLLAKLLERIKTILKIPIEYVYAWTDATIVLAWIQRPPNYWNNFVTNRVTEITNAIDTKRWHHVSSLDNPADVASRGISPLQLQEHDLWWNGPLWLREDSVLPVKDISEIINCTELEKRNQVKCNIVVVPEPETENTDIISKYSNLTKLVRVISYCLRFYYKCKSKAKKIDLPVYIDTTYLNSLELKNSMKVLVKMSQKSENINSKTFVKLNPFVDDDEILKVGGRIHHSNVNLETKHPVILAKNSKLAYLIARDSHFKTLHGSIQLMLNYIRNKYHIVGVKYLLKQILRKCVECCRHRGQTITQLMGTLPRERVTPQRPFLVSGIDFAGPVTLKLISGRSNKTHKAYIALFVCTVTKAVHIELVTSLSTEHFLAAFRRFTARRGHCKKLLSDCGTNFVGATKELQIMANKSIHNLPSEIAEMLALDGTEWQFNPAGAPHMGGLWESAIKSMKKHINSVLGDSKLTYEEYSTLLCQIESCLNSRPLTSLDNDTEGTTVALTPGHFLIGENPIVVPDEELESVKVLYNKRWIYLQQKLQYFWRKWSKEYLVELQHRNKWTRIQNNINIKDIVLVKDERLPPTKWLMGRVIDTHPGSDGLIRVVSIKTSKNSIIKRPIHKLCLLPVGSAD